MSTMSTTAPQEPTTLPTITVEQHAALQPDREQVEQPAEQQSTAPAAVESTTDQNTTAGQAVTTPSKGDMLAQDQQESHDPPPVYTESDTTSSQIGERQLDPTSDEQAIVETANAATTDEKRELIEADARSVGSDDVSVVTNNTPGTFNHSKSLVVVSKGMKFIRFPTPSSELEVPIYKANGEIAYLSKREKRSSGNATLFSPERGELVSSHYQFGPNKDPKLLMLKEAEGTNQVVVSGKWTSRSQNFTYTTAPVSFDWTYKREIVESALEEPVVRKSPLGSEHEENKAEKAQPPNARRKQSKQTTLVLEVRSQVKRKEKQRQPVQRIAQLVRNETTRTPGTRPSDAGNGGELRIDDAAAAAAGIPEELIVSTLIMMLKKEMDRRRTVQFILLGVLAS